MSDTDSKIICVHLQAWRDRTSLNVFENDHDLCAAVADDLRAVGYDEELLSVAVVPVKAS